MKIYERTCNRKILNQLYNNNVYRSPDTYIKRIPDILKNKYHLKPIAFYLPQFYPTKINDKNWGMGFTEWTNVAKAVPQFWGHYQPHIPEYLGYYDLRNPRIMEEQCTLAAEYGIYGFCFYYYYFQGKTQLEFPIKAFSANSNINFPFCLCWANENWTRRWDGQNQEILLKQTYEKSYMKDFISKISEYFVLSNYIKIEQKPVLIIYNASSIPDLENVISLWRNYCLKTGIGEIFLICAKTFGLTDQKIISKFDACVEFPPHGIYLQNCIDYSQIANEKFKGKIYHIIDYIQTLNNNMAYPTFKCAFPSWDNSSRVMKNAKIFSDACPNTFEAWIDKIIEYTLKNFVSDKRYFFINAWNEWGEGAHLEPDRKYGYAYLDVLRSCLNKEYL